MIANNWVIAGKTAVIYKFVTADYLIGSVGGIGVMVFQIKDDSISSIDEIGIEIKKSSESDYTKRPLSFVTYDRIIEFSDYSETASDNIHVGVRAQSNYPLMCIAEELEAETEYNIRGYITFTKNSAQTTEYVNETTFTTIGGSNQVVCEWVAKKSYDSITNEQFASAKTKFNSAMDIALKIMNQMTNLNYSFGAYLYVDGTSRMSSNMEFNINYITTEGTSSDIIHNLARVWFKESYNDIDAEKKFMECATDCENAVWRFFSLNNYPIYNNTRYKFADKNIVAGAIQLTGGY